MDTLHQNAVLNYLQYDKLSKQAKRKEQEKTESISLAMLKALDWATRVKISGDMRARYENVDNEAKAVKL